MNRSSKTTDDSDSPLLGLGLRLIEEPMLEFGFGQQMEYPRDGLYLFGPPISDAPIREVRYGVIGTVEGLRRFQMWANSIAEYIDIPTPRFVGRPIKPQHVPFPGFEQAFDATWSSTPSATISDVDANEVRKSLRIENRHEAVMKTVDIFVSRLVRAHDRLENPPGFWFVVIPEEVYLLGRPKSIVPVSDRVKGDVSVSAKRARKLVVQPTLFGDEEKEAEVYKYAAHFRRQLKARLLKDRIVTQIVRETTLTPDEFITRSGRLQRRVEDPATIAWKLGTSAFYKAGGKPWQLANVRPRVCYVGLVYKRSNTLVEDRFACCAAQMFLSDGEGVVFRGALGPWYSPNTREFHLDKVNARSLIELVIGEYQLLRGSRPKELFIHAKSRFTDDEWSGFSEGCPEETKIVGVQIRDAKDALKLFRTGKYPVVRGTAVILSERNAYLWTSGYVPRLDTYMGPETPNPIQVIVVRGECSLDTVLSDVLGLTKINFNSCLFNERLPVTIRFADAVGEILVSAPVDSEPKLPFKYYI